MIQLKIFRFHPITHQDANDFQSQSSYLTMPVEAKQELAKMIRSGAKFYWIKREDNEPSIEFDIEGYTRVELNNYKFVVDMIGEKLEIIDCLSN